MRLVSNTIAFLVPFLAFLLFILTGYGCVYVPETGAVGNVEFKYFNNLVEMWYVSVLLLIGVVLVLGGIIRTWQKSDYTRGIWPVGIGVVLVVLALFLTAGWNNTCYYPSNEDLQSSLSIQNSCSSEFTLRTMFYVSLLIPFVLAYIFYAWRAIDSKPIDKEEIKNEEAY